MKESGETKTTNELSDSASSWCNMQHNSGTMSSTTAASGGAVTPGAGRSTSSAAALTSLSTHISTMDSHFFEVLYIGKMKISSRKVSDSLADDALEKLRQYETNKLNQRRGSLLAPSNPFSADADSTTTSASQNLSIDNKSSSVTSIPDKKSLTKSAENVQVDTPTIDQEFDEFSQERVEKSTPKNQITLHKSGFPVALKPNVLILNVPTSVSKSNLSVLEEDDTDSNINIKFEKTDSMISEAGSSVRDDIESIKSEQNDQPKNNRVLVRRKTEMDVSRNVTENKPFLRDRSASIGTLNLNKTPLAHLISEQNRTMLFQVGRKEVRLISPDRKQVLLQRDVDAIVACHEGRRNKDHMALVCREKDTCVAYLFACDAADVAHDIVNAVRQAMSSQAEPSRERVGVTTCYHCPMLWYHRLCEDLEGLSEKRMHALILRRLEQLNLEEQDQIITKYQGGTDDMYEVGEHNAFLMMLLRAHCEGKQLRHVHDTAENRSEFLNQYLGGGTIFTKARRSLSSGFEHLLKRRSSTHELNRFGKKDSSPTVPDSGLLSPSSTAPTVTTGVHSHSSSPTPVTPDATGPQFRSNMMNIFMKVGNNSSSATTKTPMAKGTLPTSAPTWRQAMLQQVTTQQPTSDANSNAEVGQSASLLSTQTPAPSRKRTREELRALWKAAINQAILLVRMEKENARLKERQEVSAVRRIKLEYEELCACAHEAGKLWDALLAPRPAPTRLDPQMLRQAVRQGVPRAKRGEVWYLLAEQNCMHTPPPDTRDHPHYNTPYESLLRMLTSHQHAILIDLGRTFPNHIYFSSALGPGQLGLFNLLKAYSLLDPAVGYCQGLSFVAGVLLLHMEEVEAFLMLRHLMFRRGLRKQYLPDMAALQVQLYQLSRLVKEHMPDLYSHLDTLEVLPTLYAAPWMLTLFTSQFPLGFVTRVFDVLFLDSFEVVFRVCLALLTVHREALLLCTSLEEAMELLKHKMPTMDRATLDKVIKQVFTLDISQELREYEVEYGVLREELAAVTPRLAQLEERALHADRLQQHNEALMEQLEAAMSSIANYQQSQSKLESQVRNLEHSVSILTKYIISHQDRKQELPPDVRRLCQNLLARKVGFGPKITSFSNKFHSNEVSEESSGSDPEEKSTSENHKSTKGILKTGLSTPNLFSKFTKEDFNVMKNGEAGKSATNVSQETEKRTQHSIFKKSLSVNSGLVVNKDTDLNKTNMESHKSIQALRVLEENLECNNNNNKIDIRKSSESLNQFLDTFKNSISKDNQNGSSRNVLTDSHEQIRQERLFEQQLKHDFDENLKRLDKKLSPNISYRDDLLNPKEFQNQPKSLSLNFETRLFMENSKNKEKAAADSGIGTPVSPTSKVDEDSLKKTDKTEDVITFHPLSDCDVEIKFDGHSTKLKCLRPIKKENKSANSDTEKKLL